MVGSKAAAEASQNRDGAHTSGGGGGSSGGVGHVLEALEVRRRLDIDPQYLWQIHRGRVVPDLHLAGRVLDQ